MHAKLFLNIFLAAAFGPVVPDKAPIKPDRKQELSQSLDRVAREANDLLEASDEAGKVILAEVERHLKTAAAHHLKKLKVRLVAFEQEEEEEERVETGREDDRARSLETRREQAERAIRRAREAMEERRQRIDQARGEGEPARIREPRRLRESDRERVEIEIRERHRGDGPPPSLEMIVRRVQDQAVRIERLESEISRLHRVIERLTHGSDIRMPMGIDGNRPQRLGTSIENRDGSRDVDSSPEARVRALEQALAELKARANNGRERETKREEAKTAAQRKEMEAARRQQSEAARQYLELIRRKRAQVRREQEEKKAAVRQKAEEAIKQIEESFQKMDREMERAIANGEKRLEHLQNQGEHEKD